MAETLDELMQRQPHLLWDLCDGLPHVREELLRFNEGDNHDAG